MTAIIGSGLAGAGFASVLILIFQIALVKAARKGAKTQQSNRNVKFMDLIITNEDNSYSLSRLQIYFWTVVIMAGFSAVFWATGEVPDIPTNLYLLMGVNATATVAATALNTIQTTGPMVKSVGKEPDFIRDIFFNAPDSIDLPRTQMFMWTIVSLVVFLVSLGMMFNNGNFTTSPSPPVAIQNATPLFGTTSQPNPASPINKAKPSLPEIPLGLVLLMGISHGAYLGAKAAAGKTSTP